MLWACLKCATRFAVGLVACPHCGSGEYEEADVPKITSSGPSFEQPAEAPEAAAPAEAAPEPEPASPPPVSAVKAEHVEYAVDALGVPPEEAESMTKPELVELARAEPDAAERPAPSLSRPPEG